MRVVPEEFPGQVPMSAGMTCGFNNDSPELKAARISRFANLADLRGR